VQSPRLVVEVLSPSTEKLPVYQACPSIHEIVLVSQFAPYVEIWRRDSEESTRWHYAHYGPGEDVEFVSLDVHIQMEDIYQEINFDEPLIEELVTSAETD
jgi:Uma2 family endonuclease